MLGGAEGEIDEEGQASLQGKAAQPVSEVVGKRLDGQEGFGSANAALLESYGAVADYSDKLS